MTTDLLDVGPRRSLPVPLLVVVVALAAAVWAVVAAVPPTIDGHGSRPLPPAHVAYQPALGRPLF